jgi:hypothetical protein
VLSDATRDMLETIHEKVEVIVRFRLRPTPETDIYKIRWRGRDYPIMKLAYHHKVWEGRTRVHKFAVSTGSLDFRLTYDTESLLWILEEVSDGF